MNAAVVFALVVGLALVLMGVVVWFSARGPVVRPLPYVIDMQLPAPPPPDDLYQDLPAFHKAPPRCRKCGMAVVADPVYVEAAEPKYFASHWAYDQLHHGHWRRGWREHLRYVCTCGHVTRTHTADKAVVA